MSKPKRAASQNAPFWEELGKEVVALVLTRLNLSAEMINEPQAVALAQALVRDIGVAGLVSFRAQVAALQASAVIQASKKKSKG